MKEEIEKRLGLCFDSSPELFELLEKDILGAVWIFNVKSNKLEWINQSFLEAIDSKVDEQKFHEIWTKSLKEGDHNAFMDKIQEYVKSELDACFQIIMHHRGLRGETVAFLYQAKIYQTKGGDQQHLIGVCSNLNGSNSILEDYGQRMKIQEFLFENSRDAFYAMDETGVFLEIPGRKDHKYDILPYREHIGKKVSDIFPTHVSNKVDQALNLLSSSKNRSEKISYTAFNESLDGGRFFEAVIHSLPENKFLAVIRDQTEDIKAKRVLEKRSELQSLILEISAELIYDLKNFGNHILETMARLGQAVECDRVYSFSYDFQNGLTHNSHEWCAEGISPEIDNLQNVPLDQVDESWMIAHKLGEVHQILDVSALPEGELKSILAAQGIKSLVTVPLGKGDQLNGFVGFDWVKNHFKPFKEQVNLLKMFADLMHSAMVQKDFMYEIEFQNEFSAELLEKIDTPLFIFDQEGQILEINSAFSLLMGYERSNIIGIKPPYPWWPKDQVSNLLKDCNEFIQSESWKKELVFKNKKGDFFSAFVSGRRLQKKDDYLYYATVKDLKQRDEVAKSLKETKNWLALSQRSASVAHFGLDLISNKLESSSQLYTIMGINESQEGNLWKLIPKLLRKEYAKKLQEAIEERKPLNLTIEVIRPLDKKKVWLLIDGVINYTRSGDASYLQGTIRDISKEQRYTQKIEKQNKRLKEIAWLQSHELRAPLVRIMSLTNALDAAALDAESRELMDLVSTAAKDMDNIVGKIVRKSESFGLSDKSVISASENNKWMIAVVDDDPIINKLAIHQLKALNIEQEILSFKDGLDFKEHLKTELIEQSKNQLLLVLLDINMPMFNGWDVLSFISQESLDDKVQVAMFSSSISASDKKKAMEFPFVRDFIEKPLERGVLEELLSDMNLCNS